MPKIPSIPRLSIIVPVGANVAAFEDTLVSVLQNRPRGSEVVVAHDGCYDDPFGLSDEVRFVTADSSSVIDLIAAGARTTRANFVHTLMPGFQAIEDWTEPALDKFQHHDAAVVVPLIRSVDQAIVAAGWTDTPFRLCSPVASGQTAVDKSTARTVVGGYLHASFWRRGVLQSLADAFVGNRVIESSFAYGHLIRNAGWRCILASECSVKADTDISQWDASSYNRGRNLRAIRKAVTRSEKTMPLIANLIRGITRPSTFAETFGQAGYRGKMASTKRRLQLDRVAAYEDHAVIAMPTSRPAAIRRAA